MLKITWFKDELEWLHVCDSYLIFKSYLSYTEGLNILKISYQSKQFVDTIKNTNTVKPVLSGHPRDPSECLLNTGCPLKTGSLRIRLKRVVLIFLSIKRPWKGQIPFSLTYTITVECRISISNCNGKYMWSFALLEAVKRNSIYIDWICKGSHNQNKNKSSAQTKWNK